MSYQLTFHEKQSYLHAIVTGENSMANVMAYLAEVLKECLARGQSRVLVEERLVGPRLNILDVFQIASEGSGNARWPLKAVAYVDVNAEGDLMKFAENVANNRGLLVKIFPTVAEAEEWMLRESSQNA